MKKNKKIKKINKRGSPGTYPDMLQGIIAPDDE
jgi:hypothetical protein